tara:strand:+ start:384 stop:536 length:153 start_codon:yes stop_codon:yes gene_type:complete
MFCILCLRASQDAVIDELTKDCAILEVPADVDKKSVTPSKEDVLRIAIPD